MPFHAPEIIKGLGKAIYFVVETSILNDSEVLQYGGERAWQRRDERSELIKQGVIQAAAVVTNAVEHASWHDRCKGATRLIADFYVPGKIYSAVGHLFAGVVAQSKNLRNLENAASMMDHEFGFEQIVEEVLQTTKSLEPATPEGIKGQILAEFMEAESVIVKEAESLHSEISVADKSINIKKIINSIESGKNFTQKGAYKDAATINAKQLLKKKLSALENAQKAAVKVKKLPNGIIRYYEIEKPALNLGPTRGGCFVTEYNSKTGRVRSWYECYDHQGHVNRVHPKTIDGQDIICQHYPPTKTEIEIISKEKERLK